MIGSATLRVARLHRAFLAGERNDLASIGWETAYRIARLLDGAQPTVYQVGDTVQGVSNGLFGTFTVTAVRHNKVYVSHVAGPHHVIGMCGYDNLWFDADAPLIWRVNA